MQDLGISVLFQGNNFLRLVGGLLVTIKISLIAVAISIVLGIFVGMLMNIKNPIVKAITRIYLEFVRIMPQLVLLFIVYFGATKAFGISISGELAAVIVFTTRLLNNFTAIRRECMERIDKKRVDVKDAKNDSNDMKGNSLNEK